MSAAFINSEVHEKQHFKSLLINLSHDLFIQNKCFIIMPLYMWHTACLPHLSFHLDIQLLNLKCWLASAKTARLVPRKVILSFLFSETASPIVSVYQPSSAFTYDMNWATHWVIHVWANFKWIQSIKFELPKFTRQMVLQCKRDTGTTTLGNTPLSSKLADGW